MAFIIEPVLKILGLAQQVDLFHVSSPHGVDAPIDVKPLTARLEVGR